MQLKTAEEMKEIIKNPIIRSVDCNYIIGAENAVVSITFDKFKTSFKMIVKEFDLFWKELIELKPK